MKIQCDACEQAAATVVCCADEAALCSQCDINIHKANKLASKHKRLSLLSSTHKFSVCDICQDKAAFVFCLEDRALLCRDCDESVHLPDTLAAKHQRFLATGIRLGVENRESHCISENSTDSTNAKKGSLLVPQKISKTKTQTSPSNSFSEPTWSVEELLHLPDFQSKGSPGNLADFEWDLNDFDQLEALEKNDSQIAKVPQMNTSYGGGNERNRINNYNKAYNVNPSAMKSKSKADFQLDSSVPVLDFDDDAFVVPDIGAIDNSFLSYPVKRAIITIYAILDVCYLHELFGRTNKLLEPFAFNGAFNYYGLHTRISVLDHILYWTS